VAQLDVPGASSADLSPDGAVIWIGTITQQVVAIDTTSLQVKSRYAIQPISPAPSTSFDRPEEITALAGGNFLDGRRGRHAGFSVAGKGQAPSAGRRLRGDLLEAAHNHASSNNSKPSKP
jgi:hypothetical protein